LKEEDVKSQLRMFMQEEHSLHAAAMAQLSRKLEAVECQMASSKDSESDKSNRQSIDETAEAAKERKFELQAAKAAREASAEALAAGVESDLGWHLKRVMGYLDARIEKLQHETNTSQLTVSAQASLEKDKPTLLISPAVSKIPRPTSPSSHKVVEQENIDGTTSLLRPSVPRLKLVGAAESTASFGTRTYRETESRESANSPVRSLQKLERGITSRKPPANKPPKTPSVADLRQRDELQASRPSLVEMKDAIHVVPDRVTTGLLQKESEKRSNTSPSRRRMRPPSSSSPRSPLCGSMHQRETQVTMDRGALMAPPLPLVSGY